MEATEIAIPAIASDLPLSFGRLYLIDTNADIPISTDKGHDINMNTATGAGRGITHRPRPNGHGNKARKQEAIARRLT